MKYRIKYLPIAVKDLNVIVDYIVDNFKDTKAAVDLVDAIDKSVSRLEQFPFAYKVFIPIKSLEFEYRMIPVKNYLIFYVAYLK